MKGLRFVPSLLCLLTSLTFVGAASTTGGWQQIEDVKNDDHVQDIGKFAVTEYNKGMQTQFEFSAVVEAQQLQASGVHYRLVMEVNSSTAVKYYRAQDHILCVIGGAKDMEKFRCVFRNVFE
ncbi:cysteine proteinase inhibitor 1-like [Nymphaea colorata]|nr:cysteine proteinase inhibitor 1-like [Nymphaea colorata]